MTELNDEQKIALDIARELVRYGVPLFLAKPDPDGVGHGGCGYWLPKGWQEVVADEKVVDRWKPGMALCAVMGHTVDLFDVDPRSGGAESVAAMRKAGLVPTSYGRQSTPSGGTHDLISLLGVRSLDKVYPGVDIKAGDAEGRGRGFAFIAPTTKVSKATGEIGTYQWVEPVRVADLDVLGGDGTETRLAELVTRRGKNAPRSGHEERTGQGDGLRWNWEGLTVREQRLADAHVASVLSDWKDRWADAVRMAEGEVDARGRGWEALSRDWAWTCAVLAAQPWTRWTAGDAAQAYEDGLPDEVLDCEECAGKWRDHLVEKAWKDGWDEPWWAEFEEASPADGLPDIPVRLESAHLGPWMAWKGMNGDWRWSKSLGWMQWDGRRWTERTEESAIEAVRQAGVRVHALALEQGVDERRAKALATLMSWPVIRDTTKLVRSVVEVRGSEFDQQPDLLNVANGVIDLRTGDLLPHDRSLLLSKITLTEYRPEAEHPDWDQTLRALDADVADWMQVRFGQGVTGWPTSDDVLPIGQGGGSNGKSLLLGSLFTALGEHMVLVPEKLIRASPSDHPTELMTLFGARLAVIDETPEAANLNIGRLKAILGTSRMTARGMRKDNVTWVATHSLLVMTNYKPIVSEVDHGTWRRLALVVFGKTFAPDEAFRVRMQRGDGGRREAVLAWVVAGARKWYESGGVMPAAPESVRKATLAWRTDNDYVMGYIADRLVFDPTASVLSVDLVKDFNDWLRPRGSKPWGDRLVAARFGGHGEVTSKGVTKYQTQEVDSEGLVLHPDHIETVAARPVIWKGVRWRTAADE